jgi:hypothetical protein
MLDPSDDEIRRWGESAVAAMSEYLGGIRERRVYPDTSSADIRAVLDEELPLHGVSFDELLATFRDTIVPLSRQNAHPRMFGYVQAPGSAIAAFRRSPCINAEREPDRVAFCTCCGRD